MFGIMMENKPLPPSVATPDSAVPTNDVKPAAKSFSPALLLTTWAHWLIYLGMAYVIFEVEGWLVMSLRSQLSVLWWRLTIEVGMMLAAILPAFVMGRIEDRPFGDFGLPMRRAFGRNFWVGSLWGIGSLTVLMLALRGAGAFEFGGLSLHGVRIWKFAVYYALFFLVTGLFEEFLLRGYSQWILSRGMTFWPAAVLLSISFGAIHGANPGEAKTGLVAAYG
jgi:membrane protease YdiL (CAAX protease family)